MLQGGCPPPIFSALVWVLPLLVVYHCVKLLQQFANDLRESVEHVKKHPELSKTGNAAIYGTVARIPGFLSLWRELLVVSISHTVLIPPSDIVFSHFFSSPQMEPWWRIS